MTNPDTERGILPDRDPERRRVWQFDNRKREDGERLFPSRSYKHTHSHAMTEK